MHLFRVITYVLFLALIIPSHGCSTPDSGDMAQLEDTIEHLDAVAQRDLRRALVRKKIVDWLRTRPSNDEVGAVRCISRPDLDKHIATVEDFLKWLDSSMGDYDAYQYALSAFFSDFVRSKEPNAGSACYPRYDWRYDPLKGQVPEDVVFPDASARGLIEWLIASPMPPPGLVWGGSLARLLPFLCALGAGWGCPADPFYPGPATPGQVPDQNGDAP